MTSVLAILLVSVVVGMTAAAPPTFRADLNIVELADRLGYYSYLLALNETGLLETVRSTDGITLFIPTNQAFLNLPQSTRDAWAADPAYYAQLMKYHVIKGVFSAANLIDEFSYPTLNGDNTTARVNIYNHTGKSQIVTYMGSQVVQTDFVATNGMIHVISSVVGEIQNKSVLQRIEENGNYSMFLNASRMVAGLNDTLAGPAPITCFVFSNDAINNLKNGTWEKVLSNPGLLKDVMNAHIVDQTYYSRGVMDGDVLKTHNVNQTLTVSIKDLKVQVNKVPVAQADNAALNGVFHVVNSVLFPLP